MVATPWWNSVARNTYVAYFANTNGLYTSDEVRILGVAVGTVEKIEPQPNAAKVTFSVDRQYPVPADAEAAILSPSLVSARAIQLVPAYTRGPKLADGATIPKDLAPGDSVKVRVLATEKGRVTDRVERLPKK